MSIGQEQAPFDVDPFLSEYINRKFIEVDMALRSAKKFPERKEMPYKAQTGDIHYFGDPSTHSYDADITAEGFWGKSNLGWIPVSLRRLIKTGTELVSGDFSLSAGWGTTASIGSISGNDQRFSFVVTSSGTGQSALPSITLTFSDGAWPVAPKAVLVRTTGSQMSVPFAIPAITTTTMTIVFTGTPVAAETFGLNVIVLG
jgi:hypothetical protein